MSSKEQRLLNQSRLHARSSLRAAGVFLVIGTLSLLVWGAGWNVWIPYGIGLVFVISCLSELSNARRWERKLKSPKDRASTQSDEGPDLDTMKSGEFSWVSGGDDQVYGTVILLGDQKVFVELRCDNLIEERKAAALELVASSAEIQSSFEEFKQGQAEEMAQHREEILGLRIWKIGLYAVSQPDFGEVYFDSESDDWSCSLESGKFSNLSLDS